MNLYAPGDVVVVPFPFSGSPETVKRRPALVVAAWPVTAGNRTVTDYLLALITSQATDDPYRREIEPGDISFDRRRTLSASTSFVRPSYLFAADEGLIVYRIGQLDAGKLGAVFTVLRSLFPDKPE